MKRKYKNEVRHGLALMEKKTPENLSEADLAHLPELIKKYIQYSGAVGKPKVHNFKAGFSGKIRKDGQSPWMPSGLNSTVLLTNLSACSGWMR